MQSRKIKAWCDPICSDLSNHLGMSLFLLAILIAVLLGTWSLCRYLSRLSGEYDPRITALILVVYAGYAGWTFLALWRSCVRQDKLCHDDEVHSVNRVEENNNYLLVGLSLVFGFISQQLQILRLPENWFTLIILAILSAGLGFLFYPPPPFMRLVDRSAPTPWIVLVRGVKALFGAASLALFMLVLLNLQFWLVFKYSP